MIPEDLLIGMHNRVDSMFSYDLSSNKCEKICDEYYKGNVHMMVKRSHMEIHMEEYIDE